MDRPTPADRASPPPAEPASPSKPGEALASAAWEAERSAEKGNSGRSEAVQRLSRLLADPLRAAPWRSLAQRLDSDRRALGGRAQWLVAVEPSRGLEEVTLVAAACLTERLPEPSGRVLLVDADFRHRRLSHLLGWGDQPGLYESLQDLTDARGLCRPTGIPRLWGVPAGRASGRPPGDSPMDGERWAGRWAALVAPFDHVLVCGGGRDEVWNSALARLVDATYVVVELGGVDGPTARAALTRLRQWGARVLGCIATQA